MHKLFYYTWTPEQLIKHRGRIFFLAIGFLLFLLICFQPFHFRFYTPGDKVLVCVAYSAITAIVLWLSLWVLPVIKPDLFHSPRWNSRTETIFFLGNILAIAGGIFLFKVGFGFYEFSPERIITGIAATIAVGIFPMTFFKLTALSLANRLPNIKKYDKAEEKHQPLILKAERGDHQLPVSPEKIVCIEVRKNYLIITWLNHDGVHCGKLRNRMHYAEEKLADYPQLKRCHRAFMINTDFVEQCDLNAHGGTIQIKNYPDPVPVSRKYVQTLTQKPG